MKIDVFPIGMYQENSYILRESNHILFIDPGRNADFLMRQLDPKDVVDGIVLTHGHSDHVGAVDDLADYYHCPIYIHENDQILISKSTGRLDGVELPIYNPVLFFTLGNMQIGTFSLKIHHTPGHTAGSVLIQYRNVMFTGDTLFAQDIGRTDLFSGSEDQMLDSLSYIKTLPHDLVIYPGHGPRSTIAQELKKNPYLQ